LRLAIVAVGRLKSGPEADLTADYLKRLDGLARRARLGPARIVEVEDKRGRGSEAEAELLAAAVPAGAKRVVLDERGKALSTTDLAKTLGDWRDQGQPEAAFLIGGADGHGRAARQGADLVLSLGPMVWPHRLVRAMVAEQLYRIASIMAGAPYHRE
jgi:23S rRNA (pseudouridine1915-N3)-methyltransferase